MTDTAPDTLAAALALHAAGCSVVSVRADGSKHPRGTWRVYMEQRADERQITRWFADGHPGVGIVCGAVSGNLEMLELEGRAIEEGILEQLIEIITPSGLTDLWTRISTGWLERSPSGGLHFHYRISGAPVPGNTKLAGRLAREEELTDDERDVLERHPRKKIQRGWIETRGERGFVVTAPSHGTVHASGRPYELLAGGPATCPTITADEHRALHALCRMVNAVPADEPTLGANPTPAAHTAPAAPLDDASAWLMSGGGSGDHTEGGVKPGDDFEAKTTWANILGPHGWTAAHTAGRTTYWRRPGKNTPGFSATTGHAADRDRLYVFTTSTEFQTETPYTKFSAHALLNHNGDHSAAARELRRRGYGDRPQHLQPVRPAPSAPSAQPSPTAIDGTAALAPQPHPFTSRAGVDITFEPDAIIAITDAVRGGTIPDTYVRNGELVQVAEVSGDTLNEQQHGLKHTIQGIGPDSLRRLLARHADVYRMKAGKKDEEPSEVPASPTVAICKAVLTETRWPGVQPLANLVGAPVLRPDGTVLQDPGYDLATTFYYAPHSDLPHIPDTPTTQQVADALDFLLSHVIGDFPWASDSDRANYVALLVSPILRSYTGGLMPLGAISAADRGSGKTLLADIIGTLYGATVRPWVSDDDELRKAITAALMGSSAVITFDNVGDTDSVEAPTLAKLLTSPAWDDRVLGRSEQARLTNDRLWLVTGNNIRFGGDIAQRTVLVHLDPQCARPDLRSGFRIPDLDEWLEDPEHRAHLLHCLLLLARAWIVGGAPRADIAMRSFRRWARSLGGFLAFHGIDGFLSNASQLEQQDEEAAAWSGFLTTWLERYGSAPKTSTDLLTSAQVTPGFGVADPWSGTFITRANGTLPTPRGLGMMLASRRGRYFGELVLRGVQDTHKKTWFYHVEIDSKATPTVPEAGA